MTVVAAPGGNAWYGDVDAAAAPQLAHRIEASAAVMVFFRRTPEDIDLFI
jgi:hypothetical protein